MTLNDTQQEYVKNILALEVSDLLGLAFGIVHAMEWAESLEEMPEGVQGFIDAVDMGATLYRKSIA